MIIGVSGKAGAGKDVFCDIAVSEFGAEKIAFAGGLKEEVDSFLTQNGIEFELRNLYGTQQDKEETFLLKADELKEIGKDFPEFRKFIMYYGNMNGCVCGSCVPMTARPSFRSLLQWWGTEYRRSQDENYWVKKGLAKCLDPNKVYVISDCRFKNEAQGVLDVNGKLVRIERANLPEVSNRNHPSEIDLDDWKEWTVCIRNNWSLEEYKELSRKVLKGLIDGTIPYKSV